MAGLRPRQTRDLDVVVAVAVELAVAVALAFLVVISEGDLRLPSLLPLDIFQNPTPAKKRIIPTEAQRSGGTPAFRFRLRFCFCFCFVFVLVFALVFVVGIPEEPALSEVEWGIYFSSSTFVNRGPLRP
jgi:hypothetical protein